MCKGKVIPSTFLSFRKAFKIWILKQARSHANLWSCLTDDEWLKFSFLHISSGDWHFSFCYMFWLWVLFCAPLWVVLIWWLFKCNEVCTDLPFCQHWWNLLTHFMKHFLLDKTHQFYLCTMINILRKDNLYIHSIYLHPQPYSIWNGSSFKAVFERAALKRDLVSQGAIKGKPETLLWAGLFVCLNSRYFLLYVFYDLKKTPCEFCLYFLHQQSTSLGPSLEQSWEFERISLTNNTNAPFSGTSVPHKIHHL